MAESKTESKKQKAENESVNVQAMIDQLVANAEIALQAYMSMSQEQVDEMVHAMTLAGLEQHFPLAKMAFEETGRGVVEDKDIKNIFATEYIPSSD